MNRDSTGEGNRGKGEGKEGEESTPNPQPGRIQRFEDLIVWQRAIELAAGIYSTSGTIRDLAFRDQLQRAAVSISSNIAEGYERDSNADFIRFLYYAKGSCGEVRSQLHLARRLGLAAVQVVDNMIEQASLLSRQLGAYINVRETKFQ